MRLNVLLKVVGLSVVCAATAACVSTVHSQGNRPLRNAATSNQIVASEEADQAPLDVSLVRLLSSPAGLGGKVVTTTGVLATDFEGTAIYLNSESYHLRIVNNAVGLRPSGTGAADWASMNGMYVTVTGRYERGPFARWPNGLIVGIRPSNPPALVLPYFAVTHSVFDLSPREIRKLATDLHSFAGQEGFHLEITEFKKGGRKMYRYVLVGNESEVEIESGSKPDTYIIRVFALSATTDWKAIRDGLTSLFSHKFGAECRLNWQRGDAPTP